MSRLRFCLVRNDQGAAYEIDPAHPGGSASYTEWHRLIRLSGFETCELSEVDLDSDDTYIVAPWNGNAAATFNRPHRCRLIHANVERPGLEVMPYVDEMWVADMGQLAMANDPRVKFVPIGGHPALDGGIGPMEPKEWDFCPMAYAYGERERKLWILSQRFRIAPVTFDPVERQVILAKSRWGLMLHQTPHPIMTPLRAVWYACARLPIVAEHVVDDKPWRFIPFEDDCSCQTLLGMTEVQVKETADYNYHVATELLPFRKCIENAL